MNHIRWLMAGYYGLFDDSKLQRSRLPVEHATYALECIKARRYHRGSQSAWYHPGVARSLSHGVNLQDRSCGPQEEILSP